MKLAEVFNVTVNTSQNIFIHLKGWGNENTLTTSANEIL